ncbi:DUF58 domain-containing protein [Candidatus Woesearchaeota archaeon ex4484_78]|nr:MAG: DUF58 domain-containing protein [Candidatus Woesearchaeota archaeon ex4484_78]
MISIDFLHQLDKFVLMVNKKITSNYVGEQESKSTGRGLVFKDHLIYVPGEDFRTIDWKVYARTDKLFVKRFEEERNLTVHIIVDFSASMNFGRNVTKADFASMLGLGFAYIALKNNERFVLSTFSDKLEVFKPHKGRSQMVSILSYLNKKKPKGKSNLFISLSSYKNLINSKSLIVVISDFLYPTDEIRNALLYFKQHEVMLIQVLDKAEKNLDLEGDFKLKDVESGDSLRTYIGPFAKKEYERMLSDHIAKIKNVCAEFNAKFYSADTSQSVFDVFFEALVSRGRRRRGSKNSNFQA